MSDDETTVRLSDIPDERRVTVLTRLTENLERRQRAAAETDAAKKELQELLWEGQEVLMQVADLARTAGISRDTAHRILKEAGSMSWKQKQTWAAEVMRHIHGGTFERNKYRMLVNMLLLKALGKNPEEVPRSVEGVLEFATRSMQRDEPNFVPSFDDEVLRLPWPTEPALA